MGAIQGGDMKNINLATAIIALSIGTFAYGQVDLDPDGIGVYFDEAATSNSTHVQEITYSKIAYLILTNPSLDGLLTHWSAVVSAEYANLWGDVVAGGNIALNMPYSNHFTFEVFVDPLEGYRTTSATVLAEVEFLELYPDQPVHIYVWEGVTYAVSEIGYTGANPSSGDWSLPVAVINDIAPVAVESKPWGEVKALFR